MPDAPAPITTRRSGRSLSSHVAAVSSTRPPNLRPSSGLATEPVARITRSVSISVPSLAAPIRTLPSSVSKPKPSIRSILFLSNSIDTPPVSVFTTLSRCFEAPFQSTVVPSGTCTPNWPACSTSLNTSATRRIALPGCRPR